jgi:hypothetical protein
MMKGKCMSCGGSMKMKAGGSKKDLAGKYGDPDKITRGDIITAAKENAGKAKMGGSYKKGGPVVKSGMHKMPDGSMMKNSEMKKGGAVKKKK